MRNASRQTLLYTAFLLLFSSPFYWYVIRHHNMPTLLVLALMWSPACAGLLTSRLFRIPIRRIGWRIGGAKWIAAAFFIPLAYSAVAYGILWASGLAGVPNHQFLALMAQRLHIPHASTGELIVLLALLSGVVATFTISIVGCLGEEIGWRGFLVPTLTPQLGWVRTSLLVGFIHALWHYPLIFAGPYHGAGPLWYSAACFTVIVMAISFIFSWLRLGSGSVWPCVIMHASHDDWIQGFFTPLTVQTAHTKWWMDDFGAMLVIMTVLSTTCLLVYVARSRRATSWVI